MKNNNQQVVITVLVVIIVAIAAFFGGMEYAKKKVVAQNSSGMQYAGNQMMGKNGANNRVRFGNLTYGQVISTEANSITVKLSDGSSKIVNVTGSTTYRKSDSASLAEISNGMSVAVSGAKNSDGSITATNIQLNPTMRVKPTNGKTKM